MLADILFILSISILICIPFARMVWKAKVEDARNKLYDVRSDLVLHVKKKSLDKNSETFGYYYPFVNDVIRLTEKMHLEGLIQVLASSKISETRTQKHREQMRRISVELKDSPDDVKKTVLELYDALKEVLLINSNFFSAAYLFSKHYKQLEKRLHILGRAKKHEPQVASALREIERDSRYISQNIRMAT